MSETLPLVTLYLSERCNSRCVSCDYWKHGRRDLSVDEVRDLLPELEALQTRDVLISGGEPLLNRQWPEIAALLKSRGLRLWLLSAGLALAKHASTVAEWFDSVTVSLDGTSRETYAKIRGVDAFEKVCEGVRAVARLGVPTSIRVTLQRGNFRELSAFVALARALGATQVSFLAIDVANLHAFSRREGHASGLALEEEEVAELRALIERLQAEQTAAFADRFIAESPERLRHICDYFAAVCRNGGFPPVRCNAPEFSAVVGADGLVSPCFFIPGPATAPRTPALRAALSDAAMRKLRQQIRAGKRPECERCVCSMWRDTDAVAVEGFSLHRANDV